MAWYFVSNMVPSVTIFRPQLENSWNCKSSFFFFIPFWLNFYFWEDPREVASLLKSHPIVPRPRFHTEIAMRRTGLMVAIIPRIMYVFLSPNPGSVCVNYIIAYSMCRPALFRPIVGSSWISNGLLTSSRCSAR